MRYSYLNTYIKNIFTKIAGHMPRVKRGRRVLRVSAGLERRALPAARLRGRRLRAAPRPRRPRGEHQLQ